MGQDLICQEWEILRRRIESEGFVCHYHFALSEYKYIAGQEPCRTFSILAIS
jgi:hypothetical protein